MATIALVLIAAMILEALIQVVKSWVPEGKTVPGWTWPVGGAVLGVALCLLGDVDMLQEAGLYLRVPYVGCVLTGILISRGASFVHDLWMRIKDGGVILEGVEIADGFQRGEEPETKDN